MTEPDEPTTAARPSGLAATHAVDPDRLGLAETRDSRASAAGDVREDRPAVMFALVDTHGPAGDDPPPRPQLATERTGTVAIGAVDTLASGPRERLARPALDDPEARRRRQALKARLFGESDEVVKIGRFQVLGHLGAGGMGVVYAAYDDRLDRKVAIKVLRREGGHSRQRLEREAQAMARLSHPNIVGVYEVGADGEDLYVAMEFVRGESLDRWLETPRPWRTVLEVFTQAGRGLQAAHEVGLIHRDFKPANAILAGDGRVKVLDFGLARAGAGAEVGGDGSLMKVDLTQTGAMMGTPAYMSPEQFAGESLTAASDQFSFFVALYEALYRTPPFAGDSVGTLALSVTSGRPVAPPAGSDVPAWVRAVVMRGLARAPADRFPDMASALAALARDPVKRRRRAAALVAMMAISAGISGAAVRAADDGRRCEGVAAASAEVWNDERVAAAHAAFARSGAFGEETWQRIEPRIAGWIDAWNERRAERCDVYAAGLLSDTLHDRSVACLERQLARLDGVVGAFAGADVKIVEQATTAVAALPAPALCGDADYLLAEVPPPDEPRAREAVARGRASLEQARAAIDLGDPDGALRTASAVVEQARALSYEPLVALAEVVRGDALHWKWDAVGAEAALGSGLEGALASGDDRIAVEALGRRIFVRAEISGDPKRALADAEIGRALLHRVSGDTRLAWLVTNNTAIAHERGGQLDLAVRRYDEALRLAESLPAASSEAIVTRYNLGQLHGQRGQVEQAARYLASATVAAEALHGPNHPMLVPLLEGAAKAMQDAGRSREATAMGRRAQALAGRLASPSAALPMVVALLAQIAAERREDTASALADEAESLARATFGADSPHTAHVLLQPRLHRDEREADYAAATALLKATGAQGWAEAVQLRVYGLASAGHPARALVLIESLHADDAWGELTEHTRVAVAFAEVDALIALGRAQEATRVLDAIEAQSGEDTTTSIRRRLDYGRGRVAAANGDPRTAVTLLRRAASTYGRTFDADHPEFLAVRAALARALQASGEVAEAGAIAREVVAYYRGLGPGFAPEADALAALLPG